LRFAADLDFVAFFAGALTAGFVAAALLLSFKLAQRVHDVDDVAAGARRDFYYRLAALFFLKQESTFVMVVEFIRVKVFGVLLDNMLREVQDSLVIFTYLNVRSAQFVPLAGATSILFVMWTNPNFSQSRVITKALYVDPLQPRRVIKICPARAFGERRWRLCV
jgi:hypothetical protein